MKNKAASRSLAGRIGGLVASAIVVAATAWMGYTHNTASFARGVIVGGVFALVFATVAMFVGHRGPALLRLAAGVADERESAMLHLALSHGFVVMTLVASGFAIFGSDATALTVSGSTLWAGLLGAAISFAIQTRRR